MPSLEERPPLIVILGPTAVGKTRLSIQLAENLNLDEMIRFAGFREDMARCTQAFDIGVLPSIGCDTSSFSLFRISSNFPIR